jgi:very-short-patch-repair endonuclease
MPKKSSIDMNEVKRLIEKEGLSTYEVADALGCNQSHIVRLRNKFNKLNPKNPILTRSKSEAQKKYIERTGKHQREGTLHSEESREQISDSMKKVYDSERGEEIREKIAEQRQLEWYDKTEEERAEILQNLKDSSRAKAQSGEGSNFENFLAQKLKEEGYAVEQRTQNYTPGNKFHVDIALYNEKIIIEVDGPTHWQPIYGEDELVKVKAKDKVKDDILNSAGWNVVRVQDSSGSTSRARFMRVLEQILNVKSYKGKPTTHYVKP